MWVVRISDKDFVIVKKFKIFHEALSYADKMGEAFGSREIDLYQE